jgi:PmbA protein
MSIVNTIASVAQAAASKLNIQKYDIYGYSGDDISVQVKNGEPDEMKVSQRATNLTIRVWNDQNTVGATSTTDVDLTSIELALKTAKEASFWGIKEHAPDFSPEVTTPITHPITHKKEAQASVDDLLKTLAGAEAAVLKAHEAVESVPYNGLEQSEVDRFYINSAGAIRQDSYAVSSMFLYAQAEESGKKPRSAMAARVSHGLAELDVDGCIAETSEKIVSHLNYDKVKTGKYRVVFSPQAILKLVRAFGNMYNAQSVLDKQSLSSAESLGDTIASPLLCLNDDALHPEHIGANTFDGEGTPTRQTPLIQNGVLANFLHSAGTAKRMGTRPTGNANMGAKVTISSNFFHIFASDVKPEKTYSLDNVDNVILIDDLRGFHSGVQALQGSFSLPFDGWLIQGGKRTSVESATVAGDIREVLKSIIYVDPKTEFTGSGVAPYVWVDSLSVTGEE